ncbi:Transcription factor I-like 1 [Sesamum alatum]|uniref:Transcription factor I-like 1 n=1 Tax=Sesamum alatum TaxID=300844 RepID=A0AAE1YKF9_9LAMI|nr:Transcription factor I-like 1 [Sesamum alatum]
MKARMPNSSALMKQEFLKKWIKGLQIFSNFKKEMTIFERKKAIKLSADVAIASTRNAATHWSRALMADVSTDDTNDATKSVVEQISGRKVENYSSSSSSKGLMITCSNKILRRSRVASRRQRRRAGVGTSVKACSIAKKLVKNRTRVLKSLVPGGQEMDGVCLIKETLDYIASLRVQVDVMRHLAAAAERLDPPQRSIL